LLQLLEIGERRLAVRVQPQHFRERRGRAIDETAAPVVEAETELDVRVLEPAEARPLQQRLMFVNRTAHLALFAVEVSEHKPELERLRIERCGSFKLIDREIDLPEHQMVQTKNEMGRLADLAAIDPAALLQLVPFPELACGQPRKQSEKDAEENERVLHDVPLTP